MRALILVAGAALALAACSSKENANNTMNVEENLGTEMNAPEMNATDMNATDMNAMNATDMNATAPEANATTNNAM
jgi:uncharacterized protein involved in copper resistance